MTSTVEPSAAPTVRHLVRRGIPLHLAIPAVTGLLGVLLMLLGGAPAVAGGWWLATTLPIAIGAFFRDPRLAAVPLVVWLAWFAVGAVAGSGAGLANTPLALALFLGVLGAGATLVAQRAIFPATDPVVWDAHGLHAHADDDESPGQRTSPHDTLAAAELPDEIDDAEYAALLLDDPLELLEEEVKAPRVEVAPPIEADAPAGLPLDADPSPLDEGGHVTEFAALTEADLAEPGKPAAT